MSTTAYTIESSSKSDKYSKIGTATGSIAAAGGLFAKAAFSPKCTSKGFAEYTSKSLYKSLPKYQYKFINKNKDLFEKAHNISKNNPAKAVVLGTITVCAVAAAGNLIGKGIDKLVDKHNQKKQKNENLEQLV